jgi:hypothetical protein
MLGHDDVIADSYGTRQYGADTDHDIVPDDDVSNAVVDADKVLDDCPFADNKLSERHHINPGCPADNGAFSSFMDERVDEGLHPKAGPSLAARHEQVYQEFL